jgi:hypothetical protein
VTRQRKITALTVTPGEVFDCLYAACDDGSMWYLSPCHDKEWSRLPSIPSGFGEMNESPAQ